MNFALVFDLPSACFVYILAPTTDAIAHEIIEPSYSKGGIDEHQQTHQPAKEKTRRIQA
jgi:hypothetical protein